MGELNSIINKIKSQVENVNENQSDNEPHEILPPEENYSNSPFKEPSDKDIKNNTTDIVVNDITIPVEVSEETNYDNTDLFSQNNQGENIENYIENMKDTKPIKINETPENSSFINHNVFNNREIEVTKRTDNSFSNDIATESNIIKPNKHDLFQLESEKTETLLQPEPEPENKYEPEKTESLFKPETDKTESLFKPETDKTESLFKPETDKTESLFKPETDITESLFKPETEKKNEIEFLAEVLEDKKIDLISNKDSSGEKNVIELDNELDETSSLANFFEDMKQISNDKNLTLFDDAKEI
jgi:hypothetical protein